MNPFEQLFDKSEETTTSGLVGEEVGGAMSCQQGSCPGVATEGTYYATEKTLVYTCPMGHVNRCEGVSL